MTFPISCNRDAGRWEIQGKNLETLGKQRIPADSREGKGYK